VTCPAPPRATGGSKKEASEWLSTPQRYTINGRKPEAACASLQRIHVADVEYAG
jgi:hypothetical protein